MARVRELIEKLETLKGTPDLTKGHSEGLWRLIFTSGFTTQSLGGFRPGPLRQNISPFNLGQVFQRIEWSTVSKFHHMFKNTYKKNKIL